MLGYTCSKRLKIHTGMRKTKFNIVSTSGKRTEEREHASDFGYICNVFHIVKAI